MKLTHPPMGWNSWDCFGASVTEEEVIENALYVAKHLKKYGWEYIVLDIQWYEPTAESNEYHENAALITDKYARLTPAVNRFPSARNGQGFKPLADYIHSLGLKFGIHILRGIPRQAVRAKMPILGTTVTADEITDTVSVCEWNHDMYGVDCTKKGASEYYKSIFALYAEWGVDFVKMDDASRPYHTAEIEAAANAIAACGRDMVLSLSPGNTPIEAAEHVRAHAEMWRMRDDLWDRWEDVAETFDLCREWAPYTGGGAYADCDMLPLGKIGIRSAGGKRDSRFTRDEAKTVLSLWSIMGSPLFFGGHLPETDEQTFSMITNERVIKMCQTSSDPKEILNNNGLRIFTADPCYTAVFNTGDKPREYTSERGLTDMWSGCPAESGIIPPHGVMLLCRE